MLAILEEQSEWLYDISERANTWQPSFGNVEIINEGVDHAEVLLQEAVSHDSAMKYLADSRTFVVDHCVVDDRPWADETIMVSVEKRMGGGRGEGRGVGKCERWEVCRRDREKGEREEVYLCTYSCMCMCCGTINSESVLVSCDN